MRLLCEFAYKTRLTVPRTDASLRSLNGKLSRIIVEDTSIQFMLTWRNFGVILHDEKSMWSRAQGTEQTIVGSTGGFPSLAQPSCVKGLMHGVIRTSDVCIVTSPVSSYTGDQEPKILLASSLTSLVRITPCISPSKTNAWTSFVPKMVQMTKTLNHIAQWQALNRMKT